MSTPRPHWLVHLAFACWAGGMLALSHLHPDAYEALVQEDRLVEWWTFTLFAAAAAVGLPRAIRERRLGDLLVALFCIAAAGEEISWGQRLVGYTPPALFLEHNAPQEAHLPTRGAAGGQPKGTLIAILAAYGIVAPLAVRIPPLGRLAGRVRLRVPHVTLLPWFAAAIGLLLWYPARFTGEWVEAMAGALFLVALAPHGRTLAIATFVSLLVAILLERVSGVTRANSPAMRAQVACARAEVAALRDALLRANPAVLVGGRQHRRLWSLWRDGDVDQSVLRALQQVSCPGDADAARRRAFGVDPWGTAYWVRTGTADDDVSRRLEVYSFGPDRRRDEADGDDVRVETVIP